MKILAGLAAAHPKHQLTSVAGDLPGMFLPRIYHARSYMRYTRREVRSEEVEASERAYHPLTKEQLLREIIHGSKQLGKTRLKGNILARNDWLNPNQKLGL